MSERLNVTLDSDVPEPIPSSTLVENTRYTPESQAAAIRSVYPVIRPAQQEIYRSKGDLSGKTKKTISRPCSKKTAPPSAVSTRPPFPSRTGSYPRPPQDDGVSETSTLAPQSEGGDPDDDSWVKIGNLSSGHDQRKFSEDGEMKKSYLE
ncbi:hypothetical protein TREMEDRAFT_61394 [Tremella mesenterica DSM 1558]|uniref:uncharacterized protein n=1 Tax=Tremella mesenterica (strain ATCC 24925 / CBS 8224 / DSM 1558 / NBRC 9311 / NRRL Y-6157 / RJB 2259-6 / UBC 559-6) TaxID=578456 RepID=UPI0003F48FE0|nr:uncharacterized protein TREMEDRAFT_61394 [Tremella mesenterica DSM 1558]EIW70882.1 hypothetical protein TREMEDRAFT_61394 [Tremella mesenterica DSM 1558]